MDVTATASFSPADAQDHSRRLARVLAPRLGEPSDVKSLYILPAAGASAPIRIHNRESMTIPAGGEVSFETYFNAFPAGYWRRWSQLDRVVLSITLTGRARVEIYRSKIDGSRIGVTGGLVADDTATWEISLSPFEDGGWIWFDVTADTEVTIESAGWYADRDPGAQVMPDGTSVGPFAPRITVGIPTFNRPADAVAALEALALDPVVDSIIDAIVMPDQGTKHPSDEPGFAAVAQHFGDRLTVVRQPNLGGSGGYSRIMYEALGGKTGDGKLAKIGSPYILYMDDDIVIEPDSVLRATAAARYAKSPMLIGGQMLNLQEKSHLHSMGESIDRSTFMWTSAPHVHYDHDFAQFPLSYRGDKHDKPTDRNSRDLHRRIDVDFNGWWMCMIPRVVAEKIGQPLPLFIKWDDVEYGLRAARAGFATATWPSIAIWHMAWSDKDDAIDWQAYFHLRNRLIVAALYHEGPVDGLIASMRKATAKHLLCLEYSTVAIQNEAIRDFLRGPDELFSQLPTALGKVATMRSNYPDAVVLPTAADLGRATGAPGVPTKDVGGRLAIPKKLYWLARGLAHSIKPADPSHHEVPQANFAPVEARWFSLSRVDGVTVTTADGRGVVFRQRDRDRAVQLGKKSWRLSAEVADRFDELSQAYRAAAGELTSRKAWSAVFDDEK